PEPLLPLWPLSALSATHSGAVRSPCLWTGQPPKEFCDRDQDSPARPLPPVRISLNSSLRGRCASPRWRRFHGPCPRLPPGLGIRGSPPKSDLQPASRHPTPPAS